MRIKAIIKSWWSKPTSSDEKWIKREKKLKISLHSEQQLLYDEIAEMTPIITQKFLKCRCKYANESNGFLVTGGNRLRCIHICKI